MLAALPLYFAFLGTTVGLLAAALAIYVMLTPYHEITLIRQGNRAAACSLAGTAIGMAIVLFSTASGTFALVELAVWGSIGLLSQLAAFFVFRAFDVVKPPPIRQADRRFGGGFGVMFDDTIAAFYTVLVFALVVAVFR